MKITIIFKAVTLIMVLIFPVFALSAEDYKSTGQLFLGFNQENPEGTQPLQDRMKDRLLKPGSKEKQFMSRSPKLMENKEKTIQGSAFLADGETGSISGIIKDTAGVLVGGVGVRAYDSNGHVIGDDYFWSDSEGHYVVNALPTGDYYVGAFYRPETGTIWYQGVAPVIDDNPPPVHVDAPNATQNIDFILKEGGTLSGRILDQSGNPLEGIWIDVYQEYSYETPLFHYCCSDAEGSYKISCIPTGNYFVRTWSETCYVDEWYENTTPTGSNRGPVHVTVPNETPNIDFSLALGGAISGSVVLTPRNEGIEGAAISIYYRTIGGSETFSGLTGANGYYSVCGLATGDYYVSTRGNYEQCFFYEWFQDAQFWEDDPPPVHVAVPNETTNINFTLAGWGAISGRILDPEGVPLEGAAVEVFDSNGYSSGVYGSSDSEGYYNINCLPPGDYYVRTLNYDCYHEDWYNDAQPQGNLPPVRIDSFQETQNVNFTLEAGGIISGRILNQTGNPIEGAFIDVRDSNGSWIKSGSTSFDGYYAVCGLITGDYYVDTFYCNAYVSYQDARHGEGDPPPVRVVVPNATPNINLILGDWGSISGRILEPTGANLEQIGVTAVDGSQGNYVSYGSSDAEGYYSINCLPTGDYYILANGSYNQCQLSEWYQDANPFVVDPPVPPVHVDAPGESLNNNFTLEEGGSISGRILDPTYALLEQIGVEVYDSNGNWAGSSAGKDSAGYYTISCLPTGDYYICTSNAIYQGYVDTCYQDAMPGGSDPAPVHVNAPNETPNIDFTLGKGGSVSGRILDPSGTPLEQITVNVYSSNGNLMLNAYSDGEGHYAANGLPTGDYFICVMDLNYQGYLDTCYQDAMPGGSAHPPVHVDIPNETPNINIILKKGGGISGRIIDQYGNPINSEVCAYDDEGNINSMFGYCNQSDSEGHYSIQGLLSGDYYIRRTGGGQCYSEEWYGDVNGSGCGAPPVHVDVPNETSDINFTIVVPDSDNDGIANCRDNCPKLPNGLNMGTCLSGENAGGPCDDPSACPNGQCIMDQTDSDGDGLGDACDNCPYDGNGLSPWQKYQEDIDHDGIGDVCDPDDDNDAIPNEEDACPLDPDNDIDKDGYCSNVDNCPDISNPDQADTDQDGAGDICDNCPSLSNPTQDDMDHDGSGDSCDVDVDGDLLLNGVDNCQTVYNTTQEDSDRDGFGDICDSENNFAVLDLAANEIVVFDLSARMLAEKKFDGIGTVYFIAPSVNGWLVKGCPTSGCAMSNWIIWDLNPDLSIRNTITNQIVAHGYAPLASGNFVSSNIYTGDIDLYDTSGTIIKSINVWEEEDGWPYEYKKLGDVAALVNGGFVVTPEGGFPVDGPYTPFLYFYDNDLTLINKVDISGEKIHLFYLTGLDNGGFAATCSDCGIDNNNVDSVCFFSPEGELVNRINITGDITGSLYLMDVFLTGLKGRGVIVSTKGSDKVWIYHSPPQELDLSSAGITNIGALAGNIFPTQFAYILVSGMVRDLVSGEPIDGADIRTNGIGHDISRNGEYIFSEVQGKWTISARADGYGYYTSTLNMDTEDEYVLKNISMYPLTVPECRTASDCDDGQYCTGTETCVKGSCVHSGNPCASHLLCIEETDQCVEKECSSDTDCDDGQFCNGEEVCAGGICQAGVYPCAEPTPQCDEVDDRCTEGPSMRLFPNPYFQSRWMPMLLLLRIVGTETHFDGSSRVTFNPKNGIMAIPLLGDRRHIFMIGLLLPGWLSPAQSIDVTVTTGSEAVSETLDLNSLPFMLDEQGEMLKEVTP